MTPSASAIYTGWVSHQRQLPKPHGFRYRVFMMFLNLDELPQLFEGYRFWSFGLRNLAWFRRADYYGHADKPLKQEISDLVTKATGKAPAGPICMLTNMRYFGYCFNPVTFYYCFNQAGTAIDSMVSHITNTPWGEDYAYVHDFSKAGAATSASFRFDKDFHVSPFMPMDIHYDWKFKLDESGIMIRMLNLRNQQPVFNAMLNLQRSLITEKALNRLLLKFPFMTFKVIAAIYWNALLLWLKRIPFYSHPKTANK